ncbi:MAG: MurT ligase domain-containing protein [Oscillospiraceae bacterium]|nr:MurT ligase domain-containing protein [Oscillospiraceae bacterium]
MLRFYFALWAAKLVAWFFKLRGDERDDWPGLLAIKLCPDFLARIGKPPLVITVTGTNGKGTTAALISNKLTAEGRKVSFNDWGANIYAGFAINLMRCVNIFNRPVYDVSILEADERTLDISMGQIKPDYILVTNLSKDSLRRNGHPEFIFDIIDRTFSLLGDRTTAILNANDPISSQLAKNSRRVFFGIADIHANPRENIVKDIAVCPYCGGTIGYHYRLYRHFGDFYCPSCDFKTPEAKYYAVSADVEKRTMTVLEDGQEQAYPLISGAVYNISNVLACVAVLRELNISREEISRFLETQQVTQFRETCKEYDGVKYYTYGTKSQNVSAASTVFEYMAKEPSVKDVVLLLDELQDRHHPTETLTWLYETDYEFLNAPQIKKIIVGGHMYLNHKLRLLLAGIPEEKIVCVEDEAEIPNYVDSEGIETVYVLFEIDFLTKARNMRDAIMEKQRERKES